ncbi:MAG TPA: DUF4131 domain-containing protein [Thermoanaerobaculia bacterium]|nr:DUF4131 domain-containing protein [Thermoanaerobaculia bacterium]
MSTTKTIYDVRTEAAPIGNEIRGGIAGAVIGALLLAVVWQRREKAPKIFLLLFVACWSGFSAYNAVAITRAHRDAARRLSRGEVQTVEGVVTDLVPPPPDGMVETFRVGDHVFQVNDRSTKAPGLSRVSTHGGPMRNGARVKIAYRGESILKVEETSP